MNAPGGIAITAAIRQRGTTRGSSTIAYHVSITVCDDRPSPGQASSVRSWRLDRIRPIRASDVVAGSNLFERRGLRALVERERAPVHEPAAGRRVGQGRGAAG